MAITAPTLKKRGITLQLVTPTRGGSHEVVSTSDGFEIIGGARFRYVFSVPPMITADALAIRAWLHSLYGCERATLLDLPPQPAANTASTTVSSNGSAGDYILQCTSIAAATVGNVLVIGDLSSDANFSQICRVIGTSGPNGVVIEPALREAVTSSTPVEFGETPARFRLVGDAPAIPLRPGRCEEFQLEFEEVI